ncbi:MAG: cytochrome c biogenesis protein CcsA [Spirochaetes bacterium]|nr:cytochrome c biogenesis protein CcsA [Spirochaetota bacterium]
MTGYIAVVIGITVCWAIATLFYFSKTKPERGMWFQIGGIGILAGYITFLWIAGGRPPMKSVGETRLWYSLFLPVIGIYLMRHINDRWLAVYGMIVSFVFLVINAIKPSNFDRALMPALQSPLFIPHVLVYIFAYALLAGAAISCIASLIAIRRNGGVVIEKIDRLVSAGVALLSIGMLLGAIWAKISWGHYWTFDPKETWALISWLVFVIYMHWRRNGSGNTSHAAYFIIAGFLFVLVCWFGVNYLPAAAGSMHIYGR